MIRYNVEMKSFIRRFIALFFIAIVFGVATTFVNLKIIKSKVVENNQAIVGNILSKKPEMEDEIIDIITQGNSKENMDLGKEILAKYNYKDNISFENEVIINKSLKEILIINIIVISILLISFLLLSLIYFGKIYKDIKDMTDYVYNSSEGHFYNMKNRNQEGQIGLLKTELIKMTNILKEKVELLNKEKIFLNEAISDISHQLKTPMTSLIILNDLMYEDLPKETSMLKLSKVEAKVINFEKGEVKINELIKRAISPSLIPMEIKNIELKIKGNENAVYKGDMNWSSEAIVNIIKNCVEHTPQGGKIEISYEENPLYSEIVIKDNGEGIDDKDLPNIFKRFYKGKSAKEDSVGIGLAMAKSIIESQNGDIYVKSEKNKGSEFHIIFHKTYGD